jgi:hypothetical protein
MPDFGVLTHVDPRTVWPREATDFTPWLAGNLGALGIALGMDLELVQQEAPVGAFSLDILARDLNRARVVVIENQLEATDHDHLGKLLTYAAGHDASAVVWVARELREEHRQALDWLNQHTDDNLDFFGVVVEILQIDNSRPAYAFRPVALPNEWRKAVVSAGVSPRSEAYRTFFQRLIDELRENHRFTGARIGQPQSWYAFASGYSGIAYGLSFAQNGRVRADVYIDKGEAPENKELFDRLSREKREIETEFGTPLEWERLDDRRACRVAIYRPGKIDEPGTLDEILRWGVQQLMALKKVFGPRLAAAGQRQSIETPS